MTALLEVCGAGDATKRAAEVLDVEAPELCRAIRRALPFVVKRALPIAATRFTVANAIETVRALRAPTFTIGLTCKSGARGFLGFDGGALGLALDGVLGGDGSAIPSLGVLSPPQTALSTRVADAVARAIADKINARFGTSLVPNIAERPTQAAFLITHITIGEGERKATLVLGLPRAFAVVESAAPTAFRVRDPGIVDVLSCVDIELAVELGRMTVPLSKLLELKPGDTLLSDIAVTSPVTVRSDTSTLFEGRPTNVGGRFAVRVDRKLA